MLVLSGAIASQALARALSPEEHQAGSATDDASIVYTRPDPRLAVVEEPPRPPKVKVFPGHVSGRPLKAYRGGFCYIELEDGETPPRSLASLDAAQLRRVVNVDSEAAATQKSRAAWGARLRDLGSLHGAPPVPSPSPSPKAEPSRKIRSDISAFGSSGPGSTPFTIKHGVQVQTFYQHSNFDDNLLDRDSFTLRRLVIYAIGELGRPQTTWSYTLIAQGPIMFGTHAWVQEEFKYWLRVRMGEFKAPTARQQLAPTRELLTIDKSLATRVFAANALNPLGGDAIDPLDLSIQPTHGIGDNIGIQFWGETADADHKDDAQLRYFLAAFKGPATGGKGPLPSGIIDATGLVNDNTGLLYIGRLELMPLGYISYSEGAVGAPAKPRLAIDLTASIDDNQVRIDIDGDGKVGADFDDQQDRINTNIGLRATVGKFSLASEYYTQYTRPNRADFRRISSYGYYYTIGALLTKRMELCFNDSVVDLDKDLPNRKLREVGPALNYYLTGHKQKLTLDFTRMQSEPEPFKNRTELRFQYLYAF